jgi:excisionase family DNA binding protein
MGIMVRTLLTTEEVARQFGVTPQAVRGWIDRGLLRTHRIGRDHLIEEQDAREFTQPRRGAPTKMK